ncbi:MAG: hypothetical protein U9R25_08590 [Chloroflexota bacterium]|nr:hypothetical protein [Chloroflexota bacterium]
MYSIWHKIPRTTIATIAGFLIVIALLPGSAAIVTAIGHPAASQEATCPSRNRLAVNEGVELRDVSSADLRSGPGLDATLARDGRSRSSLKIQAREIWYVLEGPVCRDGVNWWKLGLRNTVGWVSEGNSIAGYRLTPVGLHSGGVRHTASMAVCGSGDHWNLRVGDIVAIAGAGPLVVRNQPHLYANQIGWLYPGVSVRILDGPRCVKDTTWWFIESNDGAYVSDAVRIRGWISEGDSEGNPPVRLLPISADILLSEIPSLAPERTCESALTTFARPILGNLVS